MSNSTGKKKRTQKRRSQIRQTRTVNGRDITREMTPAPAPVPIPKSRRKTADLSTPPGVENYPVQPTRSRLIINVKTPPAAPAHRSCVQCGADFASDSPSQRYCAAACYIDSRQRP